MEDPLKRVTFECAESAVLVITFDFCFGWDPAGAGATCLVLVDADTGYPRAALTLGQVAEDYLVKAVWRCVEQFFRQDLEVWERSPRRDSQANPAERAIRKLVDQVKVMRLGFEQRTSTKLTAGF